MELFSPIALSKYPKVLKFRMNFTETKEVIQLPFRLREGRIVRDVFWKGLLLILLVDGEGLEQVSFQQCLPSNVAKETPLCVCRDMGTQTYGDFPSIVPLLNKNLKRSGCPPSLIPVFCWQHKLEKAF